MIGRLVDGRYRVRARIARGGMATVYVATDLRLERRVALKVMHGHLSDDAVFQSRFIQEARSAARLADPHVVNVFDQGQDAGVAYLVMEYLPGITLRELLREERRLTVAQTITIMDATLSGLAAAHRAGIVHRDVKPENILLAEDGRIKIGDFGLARATTANTATGQMLLGTIAYLAPELVTRGTADARSDIYALGIMLYEMLAGEQPYQGEQPMQIAYQHATDSVPRPSAKNPQVPEPLDELVLWSTERNPDDRPTDAQVMLERLREIERDLGVAPVATPTRSTTAISEMDSGDVTKVMLPTGPASLGTIAAPQASNAVRLRDSVRRRSTRAWWVAIIVVVLAITAGGTGWWFGSGPGSLVAVPDVLGQSLEEASTTIEAESLTAVQGEGRYSLEVEPGLVIATDPEPGERLERNAEVSVILSLGPRPTDLQALAGVPEDVVRTVLGEAGVQVGDNIEEFTDQPQGTVLAATLIPRGGDPIDISGGGTVHDGDEATLTVSLGGLPEVIGVDADQAAGALRDARLEVASQRIEEFSDDFAAGTVMGIQGQPDRNWQPGDTVTLVVSRGPAPIPVPDVTGMTRDEAAAALEDAGFVADWAPIWSPFPDGFTSVSGTDPAAGAERQRGTKVYLQLTASA